MLFPGDMIHANQIHFVCLHTAALQRPAEEARAAVWKNIRNTKQWVVLHLRREERTSVPACKFSETEFRMQSIAVFRRQIQI